MKLENDEDAGTVTVDGQNIDGCHWRTAMLDDVRHAFRSLRLTPAFTASAVLTLALGLGAAAVMFDICNAYYLRPPRGVSDSGRLVDVTALRGREVVRALTYLDYADLRDRARTLSGVMAYRPAEVDLGRGADVRRVAAALVSGNYFSTLGAVALRGRVILAAEERPAGAHPVAVISERLWLTIFAADGGVVGRTIVINERPFTVVGVAPHGFLGHSPDQAFDIWVPLGMFREASPETLASVDDRLLRWLAVVGRLAPGASLAQARAEATTIARGLGPAGAENREPFGLLLAPTRPSLAQDAYALLLLAGVGVLFLAVCANLSNLFLARAAGRRNTTATRLALGAPRAREITRLLAEGVIAGLLGGTVGFLIAPNAAQALLAWSSAALPQFSDAADLSSSVELAAFVLVLSVLTGLALAVGPAVKATNVDLGAHLKGGAWSSPGRSRTRSALVVAQIALSLILLSQGGLLLATLANYRSRVSVPHPERVLLASLQPSHHGFDQTRAREYFGDLLERVRRIPGVTAASLSRDVSTSDASFFTEAVAGQPLPPASDGPSVGCGYAVVSPGFFRTLGIALVRGRDFAPTDRAAVQPVAIVNAALARRLWPAENTKNAVGRTIWISGERKGREVVGVAADRSTDEGPRPFLYVPITQGYAWADSAHVLYVRTAGDPIVMLPAVRRETASVDGGVPLFHPRVLDREIAGSRFFERLAAAVLGGAGLLALVLALVGLYGVMSESVSRRTREIGVRTALGASPADVLRGVIRQALGLAATGVAIGVFAALALDRLWASRLFGVHAAGPVVLAAVAVLLLATTLIASYLPARRAARVDPIIALRSE
ncbi:MAG: ABC transporter permease [Bacteroidales bacterium]